MVYLWAVAKLLMQSILLANCFQNRNVLPKNIGKLSKRNEMSTPTLFALAHGSIVHVIVRLNALLWILDVLPPAKSFL